ncbi:MAG: cytochrome P450 [Limnoraphis sp.]
MTLPNGPQTPRVLRMMKFVARPLDYLEDYYRRYGDFIRIGKSATPLVYVNHPAAIEKIFTAGSEQFRTGNAGGVLLFLLGDNSVLMVDGERHERQRKLLMPPFHGERLKTYNQLICEITKEVMSQVKIGQPFRVRTLMQDITLRVILKAVFGLTEGERYEQLRHLLSAMMESIGSPLAATLMFFPSLRQDWGEWSPWGRFLRYKQQADEMIYAEIRERKQKNDFDGDDILTLLMSARDETGKPMNETELRDELVTLLIAGHETTASSLTWALYWTHYLPEFKDKLCFELANLGENPHLSEIARLPYLTAVCNETLRIYPVTLTSGVRVLKKPLELGGYSFETGTVLFPCTYLVHQREDIYPEPKKFKPERFLQRQFSPYEFFPFGGGHRRCIGSAMATLEMKIALATILSDWQLKLPHHKAYKPVRRGLTLSPPAQLSLVAVNRLN